MAKFLHCVRVGMDIGWLPSMHFFLPSFFLALGEFSQSLPAPEMRPN